MRIDRSLAEYLMTRGGLQVAGLVAGLGDTTPRAQQAWLSILLLVLLERPAAVPTTATGACLWFVDMM